MQDAIAIGLKNAPSVIAAVALWLVTIWVPYINVGTTIAITLLPTRLAKGEIVNPLGIFDSKYRRYMGEYFITMGLMVFPILIGVLFMIVPAIVLSIAWTLSYYFLFEKGRTPFRPSRPRTTPHTAANGPCSPYSSSSVSSSVSSWEFSASSATSSTWNSSPSS